MECPRRSKVARAVRPAAILWNPAQEAAEGVKFAMLRGFRYKLCGDCKRRGRRSMTLYFLGIDGGGTRCRVRLRDAAGRKLGEGEGGPANIHQDFAGSINSIRAAAAAALNAAGRADLPAKDIHAGLGLAGIVSSGAVSRLHEAGLPFGAITAINDAHAACLGAHGGADGGIVICGTGSAGFAIVGGQQHAIGGWGFELGDDGSGAVMGRQAVRRGVLAIDGLGPTSPLLSALLDDLGRDQTKLAAWARAARPVDYGRFAPRVWAAAAAGDAVGCDIVGEAVAAVSALALRLKQLGASKLSMLGGMTANLLSALPAEIAASFVPPTADAADGAIMAARRAAGLPMLWVPPND